MTDAVRTAINDLVADVSKQVGIAREEILEATFVGNPIMHHLLLGINPIELGGAPFALSTDGSLTLWATEIDLAIHRNARIYVLPCIAGHVGADAAGVVLAERPDLSEEVTLLVDVGTNAEIVLGNHKRLLALEPDRSRPKARRSAVASAPRQVRSSACELIAKRSSCGSKSSAAICGPQPGSPKRPPRRASPVSALGIIEVIAEMYLAEILRHDGVINSFARRNARIQRRRTYSYDLHPGKEGRAPMRITQNDVRAIQLAKAALYAGVRLLMERMGVERVDRIRLAGVRSHIDVKYAMVLGIFPIARSPASAPRATPPAPGRALRCRHRARGVIEELVRRVERSTAVEPRFQEFFVGDGDSAPDRTLRQVT
jgi:uncharacterized 2Fe-2S/4Fe-4S cluster protein (DUF4445 family)